MRRNREAFARSAAVSEAAQKVVGEETQPMVRDKGTATSCDSPSYLGISTANLGASSGSRKRR